jgi:predicted Zn-dependent protease
MIFSENDANSYLSELISLSKADSVQLRFSGTVSCNQRFALNHLTTNGYSDELELTITSRIKQKSGTVSTNDLSKDNIVKFFRLSEDIARNNSTSSEYVEPLGKQEYLNSINYSSITAKLNNTDRINFINNIITNSKTNKLISAGYFENRHTFISILNSTGLFAYNQGSLYKLSSTSKSKEGKGSSRIVSTSFNIDELDIDNFTEKLVEKTLLSKNPIELVPGKYTVILEADAMADISAYYSYFMDARAAEEGRSFFSNGNNNNKIGNKLNSEIVNLYSDPLNSLVPTVPFNSEGEPVNKIYWIKNGHLVNLKRTRFWGKVSKQVPIPEPNNLILSGTNKNIDEIIKNTEKGLLINRFWYIRVVDLKTLLLTGLTRDGVYEIRNGSITNSVSNFRFNESPVNVFSNITDLGIPVNSSGSETSEFRILTPPAKINNFNFTSKSEAI